MDRWAQGVRETSVGSLNVWRVLQGRVALGPIPVTPSGNAVSGASPRRVQGWDLGMKSPPEPSLCWILMSWLDSPRWACLLSLSLCSQVVSGDLGNF